MVVDISTPLVMKSMEALSARNFSPGRSLTMATCDSWPSIRAATEKSIGMDGKLSSCCGCSDEEEDDGLIQGDGIPDVSETARKYLLGNRRLVTFEALIAADCIFANIAVIRLREDGGVLILLDGE